MTNMTYIQRITTRNKIVNDYTGFSRFLSFDYMGSSEFEFGSLGSSIRELLKNKDILKYEVIPVSHKNKVIDFHVISTDSGLERFKDKINGVVTRSNYTKEYTEIPDMFEEKTYGMNTDSWLDVTGAVLGTEDMINPIFFTIKKRTAIMVAQEIFSARTEDTPVKEFRMFDEVFIRQGKHPGKIIAINEDGTYNVKVFNTRYTRVDSADIWSIQEYPSSQLEKMGFKAYS